MSSNMKTEGSDTYLIRPNHQHKFKPAIVKEYIRETVRERLSGVQYDPENVPELTRSLAGSVKDKVKNAGFDRYKLVVQVVIGEQRGQGVKESFVQRNTRNYSLTETHAWEDYHFAFCKEHYMEDNYRTYLSVACVKNF